MRGGGAVVGKAPPPPRALSREGCFEGRGWGKGRFSRVYLKSQKRKKTRTKIKS